jgi:hypothetical protein
MKLGAICFPKYLSSVKLTIRLVEDLSLICWASQIIKQIKFLILVESWEFSFVIRRKESGREGVERIQLAEDRDSGGHL